MQHAGIVCKTKYRVCSLDPIVDCWSIYMEVLARNMNCYQDLHHLINPFVLVKMSVLVYVRYYVRRQ